MASAVRAAPSPARRRNRRGEGDRLREEIVTAASQMIAEAGDDSALTLRGVARRVGIAAPSIYRHFTDVDELKMAVVKHSFTEFALARDAASRDGDAPAARLGRGEQVLQVDRVAGGGLHMGEEVRDTHQFAVQPRAEGVHPLIGLELRPRPVVHRLRVLGLVERVVPVEKLFPARAVGR